MGERAPYVRGGANESAQSAVSWAAVVAGAVTASALALALLALGSGIGLGSISPWPNSGISATSFGVLTIAWFAAIELFSYGVGGYIAGRLRTNWVDIHTDEVFFRDTAHGLLVWAVGTLLSACILAGIVSSAVSGAANTANSAAKGAASAFPAAASSAFGDSGAIPYYSDMLFRSEAASPQQTDAASDRAEVGRILSRSFASGTLSPEDQAYVSRLVARRTGMSEADAEKRVADTVEQAKAAAQQLEDTAKKAADAARKIAVYMALWTFASLLIGAFAASYMATVGGRVRDDLPAIQT